MLGEERFCWVTLYHIADNYSEKPSITVRKSVEDFFISFLSLSTRNHKDKDELTRFLPNDSTPKLFNKLTIWNATVSKDALKGWLDLLSGGIVLNIMISKLTDPKRWGPYYWKTLDQIVDEYPDVPTGQDLIDIQKMFKNLDSVLPCERCSKDYQKYLSTYPLAEILSSRDKLRKWLQDLRSFIRDLSIVEERVTENVEVSPADVPLPEDGLEDELEEQTSSVDDEQPKVAEKPYEEKTTFRFLKLVKSSTVDEILPEKPLDGLRPPPKAVIEPSHDKRASLVAEGNPIPKIPRLSDDPKERIIALRSPLIDWTSQKSYERFLPDLQRLKYLYKDVARFCKNPEVVKELDSLYKKLVWNLQNATKKDHSNNELTSISLFMIKLQQKLEQTIDNLPLEQAIEDEKKRLIALSRISKMRGPGRGGGTSGGRVKGGRAVGGVKRGMMSRGVVRGVSRGVGRGRGVSREVVRGRSVVRGRGAPKKITVTPVNSRVPIRRIPTRPPVEPKEPKVEEVVVVKETTDDIVKNARCKSCGRRHVLRVKS